MHYYFSIWSRMSALLTAAILFTACSSQPAAADGESATASPDDAPQHTIIILGDSLTAGWGLEQEQAYPALLQEQLRQEGYSLKIVNAGISGDTLAGGFERLPWLLEQEPDYLIVALGANDGLRGHPVEDSRETLRQIIETAQAAEVNVALIGIDLPWNYGKQYRQEFRSIFPSLAEEYELPLLPFLLEGVAMVPELNFSDRLHPNETGQQKVAEHVKPFIRSLIDPEASTEEASTDNDEGGESPNE